MLKRLASTTFVLEIKLTTGDIQQGFRGFLAVREARRHCLVSRNRFSAFLLREKRAAEPEIRLGQVAGFGISLQKSREALVRRLVIARFELG